MVGLMRCFASHLACQRPLERDSHNTVGFSARKSRVTYRTAISDSDEIADWIDDGLVSPSSTDSTQFPASYEGKLAAVIEGLALLLKHKAFFDWAVERLIEAEVITDGMAAEKFRELYG
jgi:hypothetical protein